MVLVLAAALMMCYCYPVVCEEKKLKIGYIRKRLVVQLFAQRSLKTYGLILIYVKNGGSI